MVSNVQHVGRVFDHEDLYTRESHEDTPEQLRHDRYQRDEALRRPHFGIILAYS
jgi:hypothetical protein